MSKEINTQHESGLLERFIEELSDEWGIELSDLQPAQDENKATGLYAGYGVHLARQTINSEVIIRYERSPSDEVCDIIESIMKKESYSEEDRKNIFESLYNDKIVSGESAYIKRGDKAVQIDFVQQVPKGVKDVYIFTTGLDDALEEANGQSPIYNLNHLKGSSTRLRFAGSASKDVNELQINPIADMQNACNFVVAYLF
tara:strand:+ start:8198 stop:8797 length:600 start_codon:yes stop_codon:yes gene_type:complete